MNRTTFIATTAVFAALVAVATAVLPIPLPRTQGFLNFGDAIIFITGIFFGPFAGLIAGGIGSALADIILGYAIWSPFTLVIKGAEGFVVGFLAAALCKVLKKKQLKIVAYVVAMIVAGLVMIIGYFFATWILYGLAAAVISIGESAIQISASIAIALLLLGVSKSIMIAINKKK